MGDIDEFDEYIDSLERLIVSSLSFAPDLHGLEDAFERLWQWHDVDRFSEFPASAGLDSTFRTAAEFEVSPPHSVNIGMKVGCKHVLGPWMRRHRWLLLGGALGLGLLVGYKAAKSRRALRCMKRGGRTNLTASNPEIRPAIVVLGADSEVGLALVTQLELAGFIVIASISTMELISSYESRFNGYVKALLLDPEEPTSTTHFIRSVQSALSLSFPLDSSSSRASPIMHPRLHSIISLLSLPGSLSSILGSLSTVSTPPNSSQQLASSLPFASTYIPYLARTHVTPFQTIHALLPLFRNTDARSRARARDMHKWGRDKDNTMMRRNIIVCLPKSGGKVDGILGAEAQAMSSAATACGLDLLRKDMKAQTKFSRRRSKGFATLEDRNGKALRDLKVLTIDVNAQATSSQIVEALLDVTGRTEFRAQKYNKYGCSMAMQILMRNWRVQATDMWRGERFSIGGPGLLATYGHIIISYVPHRLKRVIGVIVHEISWAMRETFDEIKAGFKGDDSTDSVSDSHDVEKFQSLAPPSIPRSSTSSHNVHIQSSGSPSTHHESDHNVISNPGGQPVSSAELHDNGADSQQQDITNEDISVASRYNGHGLQPYRSNQSAFGSDSEPQASDPSSLLSSSAAGSWSIHGHERDLAEWVSLSEQ